MYWKTYFGKCIYQIDNIYVYQNLFYRWLTFESSAIQTLIHRHHIERMELNYIQVLTHIARLQPGPTCVLGLGGGSVLHALAPVLGNIPRVAVEQSSAMISVAKSFFRLNDLQHLTLYQRDAADFVEDHQQAYQHLLVDLYTDNQFPSHCHTASFFEHCQRLLAPGGVLAVNLANPAEQLSILKIIQHCFPHRTIVLPVKKTTNLIILAYQGKQIQPLLQLLRRCKKLSWTPQYGFIGILS